MRRSGPLGQDAASALGSIDIFVSNAGIIEWEPITKITLECWNRILPSI
jgi:NAD(P)-dependent dehydrogenase (short-subunit alcohol dehydrogenase family)